MIKDLPRGIRDSKTATSSYKMLTVKLMRRLYTLQHNMFVRHGSDIKILEKSASCCGKALYETRYVCVVLIDNRA